MSPLTADLVSIRPGMTVYRWAQVTVYGPPDPNAARERGAPIWLNTTETPHEAH